MLDAMSTIQNHFSVHVRHRASVWRSSNVATSSSAASFDPHTSPGRSCVVRLTVIPLTDNLANRRGSHLQILSRELGAVDRFSRAAFHFVGILEDERLKVFAAEFVDGLTAIGESELHARQMDRCQVLGVQSGRKEVARERFKELNERGRKIVLSSASRLKALRDDFERDPSQGTATLTGVQLKEWRDRLYGMLVDLEMKGSDVQQVQESIDEYTNAMRTKGPGAVLTLTERKVKELHKVRGQSGRGATTNIAIWKAIAIAVFIGVGLWAIFKCSFFGCSITENLAYGTIMLIAFLVAIFC